MDKSLVAVFSELLEIIKSSKSFVIEQYPDYIRQVMEWSLYSNILTLKFLVPLMILVFIFLIVDLIVDNEGGLNVLCLIVFIVCFIVSMSCYFEIQQIKRAPKVFIVDYIKCQLK